MERKSSDGAWFCVMKFGSNSQDVIRRNLVGRWWRVKGRWRRCGIRKSTSAGKKDDGETGV